MIIGIVGGVGCGKSTVLTYLKEKNNAYIIEADKVAKEIMEKGNEVYNKVIREFPESLDKDDNIDRKKETKRKFFSSLFTKSFNHQWLHVPALRGAVPDCCLQPAYSGRLNHPLPEPADCLC